MVDEHIQRKTVNNVVTNILIHSSVLLFQSILDYDIKSINSIIESILMCNNITKDTTTYVSNNYLFSFYNIIYDSYSLFVKSYKHKKYCNKLLHNIIISSRKLMNIITKIVDNESELYRSAIISYEEIIQRCNYLKI